MRLFPKSLSYWCVFLFPVLVFTLPTLVSADVLSDQRDAKIAQELNCVARAYQKSQSYDWSDLCYTVAPTTPAQDLDVSLDGWDEPQLITGSFDVFTGYRTDDLNFNIAGTTAGTDPNILSELTWSDLQSFQIQGQGEVVFLDKVVLEGSAAYARIFSGDNQDSDYDYDNRTGEFSRSNNAADVGHMNDFSGGLGYRINLEKVLDIYPVEKLSVTPLVGYAYNAQNLRMQDGYSTIPAFGAFGGLNSKYETQWKGLWLGTEIAAKAEKLTGSVRFEYHFLDYYADADWNLRSDFQHPKSFEHSADGSGFVISTKFGYELTENWQLSFKVDYHNYETERGIDKTFFSSGTILDTQLNVVNWYSYAISGGLKYSF